ncbi:DUF4416 family protein [Pseudothermotoga thermarum]|uniref:DUF4416 domain-containing protein n=1 Tax=Pseudothermotoga thermarum DSM 5069 TaxID=688269 RepID=F7YWQ6_9THEM|nr:DUF4416 family protein [Pseudothermotoga thermarum]AEH52046.1 hypothetical protein Theth_2008 [Pseudothermotoga thermarum DSM 5069]
MGEIKKVELVNLVIFIFSQYVDYWINELRGELEEKFGPIDYISPELPFGIYTAYYNDELGSNLTGKLLSFEKLIHPSLLADVKIYTNWLEKKYAVEGKRRFNLDPGYVHHMNFVLASTKPWANRIYLKNGIYAEVTLMYLSGEFRHWEFTYPNYQSEVYKKELEHIRKLYIEKRKRLLKGDEINENRNKGFRLSKERGRLQCPGGDTTPPGP